MAYGDSSAIVTQRDAYVFNQMYSDKAIAIMSNNRWLVNQLSGRPGQQAPGEKWIKSTDTTGRKLEVTILGANRTMTYMDSEATEFTTATLTPTTGLAAYEFSVARIKDILPISEYDYETIRGDALKGASLIDRNFYVAMETLENTLNGELNDTGAGTAPSRSHVGSWVAAVSDGSTSGESNYAVYGTIDRTAAGNTNFKGNVTGSVGTITPNKIDAALVTVRAKGGKPKMGIAGSTVYTSLLGLFNQFSEAKVANQVVDFAGAWVRYSGVNFGLDADCPAQTLGILDPETWVFKRLDVPFTRNGFEHDVSRNGAYVLDYGGNFSLICVDPRKNIKLTGITG